MIIDVTGAVLLPGNFGKDCRGNGEGKEIECCCDECDYCLLCFPEIDPNSKAKNNSKNKTNT